MFKKVELKRIMRHDSNASIQFTQFLNDLGDYTLTNQNNLGDNIIEIPEYINKTDNIANSIYGSRIDNEDITNILNSAILCPTNKDCEEINEDLLTKLQGDITEYHSNDTLVEDNKIGIENITEEFLNSLTISSLPPDNLRLKKYTVVILIRNINKILCNGTRLIVTDLGTHF